MERRYVNDTEEINWGQFHCSAGPSLNGSDQSISSSRLTPTAPAFVPRGYSSSYGNQYHEFPLQYIPNNWNVANHPLLSSSNQYFANTEQNYQANANTGPNYQASANTGQNYQASGYSDMYQQYKEPSKQNGSSLYFSSTNGLISHVQKGLPALSAESSYNNVENTSTEPACLNYRDFPGSSDSVNYRDVSARPEGVPNIRQEDLDQITSSIQLVNIGTKAALSLLDSPSKDSQQSKKAPSWMSDPTKIWHGSNLPSCNTEQYGGHSNNTNEGRLHARYGEGHQGYGKGQQEGWSLCRNIWNQGYGSSQSNNKDENVFAGRDGPSVKSSFTNRFKGCAALPSNDDEGDQEQLEKTDSGNEVMSTTFLNNPNFRWILETLKSKKEDVSSKEEKSAEDTNMQVDQLPKVEGRRKYFGRLKALKASGSTSICQRDELVIQLYQATLECLICCERVKQREPVWSCTMCFHILHFWCIDRWAKSSLAAEDSDCWRCPACQNEYTRVPKNYMCFCSKSKLDTEWNRRDIPHSCGEVCRKIKDDSNCEHGCMLLCHPGPCPPCAAHITRECGCGRTKKTVLCSAYSFISCDNICNRRLNCGQHYCYEICHQDSCAPCKEEVQIHCFCGKTSKTEKCGADAQVASQFSCNLACERQLDCGKHKCTEICHEGDCATCPSSPSLVTTCPCGKMQLTLDNVRMSCEDPIPTCDSICGKRLNCGSLNKPHFCRKKCHEGECGPCNKRTLVKCRCGAADKLVPCTDLLSLTSDFRCKKKCQKKRYCGKHKCNKECCIEIDHMCPIKCTGTLSCGKHRCDLLCHPGKCGNCLQSSFEELYCHCRKNVLYPPIPCGTRPPPCNEPCARTHECDHPPMHPCHSDNSCPPCTAFTDKYCYGKHELRRTVPCHQKEFSCGRPCGKPLPCGVHLCVKQCHPNECIKPDEKCRQECPLARSLCGHPCNAPCHFNTECPQTPCKKMVHVTCLCGNMGAKHPCHQHTAEYEQYVSTMLAGKMNEARLNSSVNVFEEAEKIDKSQIVLRTLECTEECRIIMRNKRLAMCLQIQNPDLSGKLTPRYSDFMKQWAKRDPNLCSRVHDQLAALVQLAKESKHKSRSYSFEVMNREKRQFVHEYCAHFGCESQAYDAEPKRNIVATATKDKCWMPAYSLLEVVQRDMGYRKPAFGLNKIKNTTSANKKSSEGPSTMVILPVQSSSLTGRPQVDFPGDPL